MSASTAPHDLGPVAILDLPDMDSVASEHRARVEAILPRVDAVAWVTDPEKYHDAALHDDFLRAWLARLARQVVIVNKADRLVPTMGGGSGSDLEADLRPPGRRVGGSQVDVLLTSRGARRRTSLACGTGWPTGSRPRPSCGHTWRRPPSTLVHRLAREAGIDPTRPVDAVPRRARRDRRRSTEATAAVLRAVDLPGLERQAEAATRARARARGTGPMGRITSLLYRASGRETQRRRSRRLPRSLARPWSADAGGRGDPGRPVRAAACGQPGGPTPPCRGRGTDELRRGLERAVDRAIGGLGPLEPPTSRWWPVIGFLQMLATAGIALAVAWIVIGILGGPAAGSVEVPIFGSVPTPFASLVAFLIGYLLARLLGSHAGWVGRRWARRVRDRWPPRSATRSASAGSGPRCTRGCPESPVDRGDHARSDLRTSIASGRVGGGIGVWLLSAASFPPEGRAAFTDGSAARR